MMKMASNWEMDKDVVYPYSGVFFGHRMNEALDEHRNVDEPWKHL